MSEEVATETKPNFNVVPLAGVAHLSEEALGEEVGLAVQVLKDQGNPRSTPVQWQPRSDQPPSPFVAALVDVDGVPTMFIGLALEVIQAMHKAEK